MKRTNEHKTRNSDKAGRLGRSVMTVATLAASTAAAMAGPQSSRVEGQSGVVDQLVAEALAHQHDCVGSGGMCIATPELSIMFAPEATAEEMRVVLEGLVDDGARFNLQGSRWTSTATNGAVEQGEPITLTYSFVPDGTQISGFNGEPASPSELYAVFDANFPGGRAAWKAAFAEAFERWSEVTNITYIEVSDDGAGFPLAPGQLGARGDVRIAMHPVGGSILAYNFYPNAGGDMVMDSSKIATFVNPQNNFRSLRNVLAHEHGHGLGLAHVIPQAGQKLMEPALNLAFDGPQEDDVRAAQHNYGDPFELNDAVGSETFVGGPLRDPASSGTQVMSQTGLALERDTSSDWYGFTAFAGVPIAVRVEPVGTTYQSGPQNGQAAEVNAKAARNLALRLWRRISAQTNELQLMAQIDFNDAGEAEYHPPVPYNLAGYVLAEVYSTDGVNDVQQYNLTISNSAIQPPVEDPSMRVFNGASEVFDGTVVQFGAVTIGQSTNTTITIHNDGPGLLTLGTPTLAGPGAGDYSFTLLGSEVPAGESAVMAVAFSPTAEGVRQAVLSLPNNDPDQSNFSFIVSGLALPAPQPAIVVEADNFEIEDGGQYGDELIAPVQAGQSGSVALRIRNTGDATLLLSSVTVGGPDEANFTAELDRTNVPAASNQFATLTITLNTSAQDAGSRVADFVVASNDPDRPALGFSIAATVLAAPITDCNGNGTDDADDIAAGDSEDCNGNGVPDECESDADGDGVIDDCDNGQDAGDNGDGDEGEGDDNAGDDNNDGGADEDFGGDEGQDEDFGDEFGDDEFGDEGFDGEDDGEYDEDDFADDVETAVVPSLCGAGVAGFMPLMFAGLAGVRGGIRRRVR